MHLYLNSLAMHEGFPYEISGMPLRKVDNEIVKSYNINERAHHASDIVRCTANHGGTFFTGDVLYVSVKPLKPAMCYKCQIHNLVEEHGLVINDPELAKRILRTVNYYRLSGYGIGLLDKTTDRYIDGTTIEHLYSLYMFDSHLRNIINPVIEHIEVLFRTAIAYHLGIQYGAECYRDRTHFKPWISGVTGRDMFDAFNDQVNDAIRKQAKKPFVIHHQQVYGGHFPIWVIVELISLGSLSTLYSLMNPQDRTAVAKAFGTNSSYMKSWFAALVELRNICAHYGRIYNMPLDSLPKLPHKYCQYAQSRLFTDCLAIRYIVRGEPVWNTFVSSLQATIDEHAEVNLQYIGFPANWEQLLR